MTAPARQYSWPPFAPGHELSTTHGAYSERKIRPLADAIAAELVDVAPWASGPVHAATVAAWSRTEAQVHLLVTYLDEHGLLDAEGVPRPAVRALDRAETRAASLRAELGLSPLSLARLLGLLAGSKSTGDPGDPLERLRATGRQIREAVEAGQT